MARVAQVQDPELKRLVAEARAAYLANDHRGSIEKSVAAFLGLLQRQPDFLTSGPFAGNNRRVWPALGVKLDDAPDGSKRPVYEREEFTNPEAITYFEYVTDCIVAAGK